MRYTFHIGLHCTDEDRLLSCLLANEERLMNAGTVAARPGRFRPALRKAMLGLKGSPAPEDVQQSILDAVMDVDHAEHVLFSSDSFLCVPMRAVVEGKLYPLVGQRAPWIRNLFPQSPARFCLALRNPATFLPAIQQRFSEAESFGAFLDRIDPEALSWADMVARLRDAIPDAEIVAWCNEDTPLLWPELLRLLAHLPDDVTLDEELAFVESLMRPEGASRLQQYLGSHPQITGNHRQRIISVFLDKFADAETVETDPSSLPDWDTPRIAALTEAYEGDVARIGAMDGVRLLVP